MTEKGLERREFLLAAVCTAAGGLETFAGENLIARFGMVTDIHYAVKKDGYDWPGNRCFTQSPEKLRDCVKTMNSLKVDFLIELGDFKDQCRTKEETLQCLEKIEKEFSLFNGPRYHALGNHDMDIITKAEFFSRISNTGQKTPKGYYSFTVGKMSYVVLDPNYTSKGLDYANGNFNWTDANIPDHEIKWLEGVLKNAPGDVVVFSHQLIDPTCPDAVRIKNAALLREMFEKSGKVKAVFTGHHHNGHGVVHNGIFYYTLRALVKNRYPENNSYAEVSMYDSGRIVVKGFVKAASAEKKGS